MDRAAIVRLYVEERVSSVTLARAYNTSPATILRVVRKAGIPVRTFRDAALVHHESVPRRPRRHDSTTYNTWANMLQRCLNQRHPKYPLYYGGRGISVCERWRDYANFLADMGERPAGLSIDRINVDGNYEPGNCRWATAKEQRANQRPRMRGVV